MSFRDDVDALAARHTSLEHELADKTRELADAARVLEEARAKRRLPVLDNIRIATPCSASWDRMLGDDRVRHCGDCNKNVYNLSSMTRDEAETLIAAKNGDLCARYYQRPDGTIITSDCAVGVSRRRKRRLIAAGAAALLAGGGLAARSSSSPHRTSTVGVIRVTEPVVQTFAKPVVAPVPVAHPIAQPLMGAVAPSPMLMGKISKPLVKKP